MRRIITLLIFLLFSGSVSLIPLQTNVFSQTVTVKDDKSKKQDTLEKRYSPFNAVQIATADIAAVVGLNDVTLDPAYCRYLWLLGRNKKERVRLKESIDFILNSLNPQYRDIIRTAVLPAGTDDPLVVRVNLQDYNISPEAWDNLAEKGSGPVPIPDPFFHIVLAKTKVTYKEEKYYETEKQVVSKWPDGTPAEYKTVKVEKTRKVKVESNNKEIVDVAPWLALEDIPEERGGTISALIKLTRTKNPILNGQWFLTYAPWAPAYYELIGLKRDAKDNKFKEKDIEKLAKFDFNQAKKDIIAGITDTKLVALHNRILQRYPTLNGTTGGYYWRSEDTDAGIDDEDYLLNIDKFDNPTIKAQEIIFSGRNYLNFYALTDAKGNLLDVANIAVARHSAAMPTRWEDPQIYSAKNCMLCHSGGQQYIKDKVRAIAQGNIALLVGQTAKKDRDLFVRIKEAFSPDLKVIIDGDNARYIAAVKATNGLEGKVNGNQFEDLVWQYYDAPITLDTMALEAGLQEDELRAYLQKGINLDYTLTGVLQSPQVEAARLPWERRGYASMMLYLIDLYAKQGMKK